MAAVLVKDPVYLQLNRALRHLIRNGKTAVGEQFLTERDVGARFGVSRATANKALSNLVAEGILEFRKGLGTFVQSKPLDYDLQSLVSFTGKAEAAGKIPTTQLLRFATVPTSSVDEAVTAKLQPPADGCLYYMERLRLADQLPVIFERRYVPVQFCPDLAPDELLGSLYDLWIEKYGLEIVGAEQTIHAVNIRAKDAKLLQVPKGAAGFLVTSIGYLRPQRPLWWEQTIYRGDAYEFHNSLGPIKTARPAGGSLIAAGTRCVPLTVNS